MTRTAIDPGELLCKPGSHSYRRHVVHFRHWPGTDGWKPPRKPPTFTTPFGERIGLVLVAASELGGIPDGLGLGAYLVVLGPSVLSAGLIVPDGLDPETWLELADWAAAHPIDTLRGPQPWSVDSVSEFFDPRGGTFVKRTYSGTGWCIGADLGRVFGLVAEHVVPRRGANRESWDLWLPGWGVVGSAGNVHRRSPHRPCLRASARRVGWQISFGPCGKDNGKYVKGGQWTGAFIDVLSLAYALDADRSASFGEHRSNVGLARGDLPVAVWVDADGAAQVARAAVAVHELVVALDERASPWFTTAADRTDGRLRLDLARTSSPGAIAAQVLDRFGVRAPLDTFDLSDDELHAWAESFHGGWCETDPRLLGDPFEAVSADVSACFPLVANLIGWWSLMCAERVVKRRVTASLRRLCRKAIEDPGALFDPAVWRQFGCCLVLVNPSFEVFPVEVEDPLRPDGRLEFVPLSSPGRPVWLSALDVIGSAIKSRRVPDIIEATAYVPEGRQAGIRTRLPLLPGVVADGLEGPARPLVEHRLKLKEQGDLVAAAELRVVVNALVFGNFARMDDLYLREGDDWVRGERPGPHICLPIASSVTAGSHLLLALLERLVTDRGGVIAYRDTDSSIIPSCPEVGPVTHPDGSMVHALPWSEIDQVLRAFDALGSGGFVWKDKRGARATPYWALLSGPKRHLGFVGDSIVEFTESELGGTYVPPPTIRGRAPEGYHLWSLVAVERELAYALAKMVDPDASRPIAPWDIGQGHPFPALRRFMVKTPEMARLLPSSLGALPGTRYVEARGAPWSGRCQGRVLVALDPGGDLADWMDLSWVDKRTGEPVTVTTDPENLGAVIIETLDERAAQWSRAPRSEPLDEVVIDPHLVAYPGHVSGVIDGDEDGLPDLGGRRPLRRDADRLGAVQKEARRLRKRAFAARTALPPTVAERAAAGQPISERNVARALAALGSADNVDRLCALDGCNEPVRQLDARYCTKAHRDRAYRDRKKARTESESPTCPGCGAVLLGLAAKRGMCRDCAEDPE